MVLCTGYKSPITFPCLLYHKSTALLSHKLYDTRELAWRDMILRAVKCELLRFSKGVPAVTSQKYCPAENFPRSFGVSINPAWRAVKSHFFSFQLKTKKLFVGYKLLSRKKTKSPLVRDAHLWFPVEISDVLEQRFIQLLIF